MDGISVSSLITGLASGVISSALTYFSTRSKIRLDMRVEYDKDLHEKRLALYKELWPKTKPLSRFDPHITLTYNIVREVAEQRATGISVKVESICQSAAENLTFV